MTSNHMMLMELDDAFTPKRRGIINAEEIEVVKEHLKLDERSLLDLQNLRDFTVLWFQSKNHGGDKENNARYQWDQMDKISAILSVIDSVAFNKKKEEL